MDCIRCDASARYNRALVDLRAERIRGGLCADCERRAFDGGLDASRHAGRRDCEVCDAPARFALAEHKLEVSAVTGAEYVREGYGVDAETPAFCERHAPFGLAPGAPATVDPARERP